MSKKTPLTSTVCLLSKLMGTSWIMDKNWVVHESPGRKPDFEGVKSFLLTKCLDREL